MNGLKQKPRTGSYFGAFGPPRAPKAIARSVAPSSKFTGDLDLYKFGDRVAYNKFQTALENVIERLKTGQKLDDRHRDHAIVDKHWGPCRDCHIRPDIVLLYRIEGEAVRLLRLGSHATLFGK